MPARHCAGINYARPALGQLVECMQCAVGVVFTRPAVVTVVMSGKWRSVPGTGRAGLPVVTVNWVLIGTATARGPPTVLPFSRQTLV